MRNCLIVVAFLTSCLAQPTLADDWPMWRADTRRSGVVPESLANELHLQWVRDLPARRVAWPNESRLHFDASYEPIVLGERMFVGSSVDGSVTAYQTGSGQFLWRFRSEGPVRFAPVAWNGRVFFGSDDGFLYCLHADSGELAWKMRGAPADRADYRHLGNNRLVSYWPVRGGPVLKDGIVYFTAGLWPTLGIFVHAVDAKSGQVLWTNSNTNHIRNVRIDHNVLDDAGLSPQGYCLIVDDKLVVPNGRSMPARFDIKTGQLQHYAQGYRHGDSHVTAGGPFLFVGPQGVVNVHDGREVGSRWVETGRATTLGRKRSNGDLFESTQHRYKFLPGCDSQSVFDGSLALGVAKGFLYSYDLSLPKKKLYELSVRNVVIHPARWDLATHWERCYLDEPAEQPTRAMVKAGNRLYTHVGTTLFGIDIPDSKEDDSNAPRIAWKKTLEGVPSSMLAAAGKLFVVLDNNRICCFGAEQLEVKRHEIAQEPLAQAAQRTTRELLDTTGVTEGYALVLGLDSGELIDALVEQSDLHVIAVDDDEAKVNALREHFVRAGVYEKRVELLVGDPQSLRLPPHLASLIVSERSEDTTPLTELDPTRLFSLLRPYGGLAVASNESELQQRWTAAAIAGATVESLGDRVVMRCSGALAGSADWTHETGSAARTYFSADERVKAPLAILWYGDGPDHGFEKWKDYDRGVKPQVARGRLFAFDDRSERLSAIDIYTGRLLWRHKTGTPLVRFASLPDAVYVASGLKCDVLDPATGAVGMSFPIELPIDLGAIDSGAVDLGAVDSGTQPGVVAVRVSDSVILIAIGFDLPTGYNHKAVQAGLWDAKILIALDRRTGTQLWERTADRRFNLHAIALGEDAVYCVDSLDPLDVAKQERRGASLEDFPSTTMALDARTGGLRWEKDIVYQARKTGSYGASGIQSSDDWSAFNAKHDLVLFGKLREIHALQAATGEEVWTSETAGMHPIILGDDNYINQAGHRFDVRDGNGLTDSPLFQRTRGCNYAVGGQNLLFLRNKCAAYVDIEKQEEHSLRNLRSGCSNNFVAAGGLLNVPCFSTGCVCNYPLQTSFSMVYLPESATWSGGTPIEMVDQ